MTLAPKVAQGGDLTITMTAFFTAAFPCYITDLRFYNRALAHQDVFLQIQPSGGTPIEWPPFWPLDQFETGVHLSGGERLLMAAGDVILGQTTSGSAVGWSLSVNEDV